MCGIAGVMDLGSGPPRKEELLAMCAEMSLRGPDDAGTFTDERGGLGHRRLSIIDLTGGHQPLFNEDGQIATVLNGEIYNFSELRADLSARGHRFKTRSDTEVIVHGYEEWGDDVVHHLDGMFAFAVWDARKKRMVVARDRFGKKPLVYFRSRGRFAFASTVTALLKHAEAPRSIDRLALARYLALEFVPAPASIIDGMFKLPPGTLFTIEHDGKQSERRFWQLNVGKPDVVADADGDAEEQIRRLLVEATRRRLVADVPVGIFLSGGIDSSSVVAAAAEAGARGIKTFSIGFGEASFDESAYAREMAERFGTDHIEERCTTEDLLAIVPRLGKILDEPMADGSIVPTNLLSKVARRHVTVALGGDGGDELFAGYPTYVAHRLAALAGSLFSTGIGSLLQRAAQALPVSHGYMSFDFRLKKMLGGLRYPEPVRNYVWLGAFQPEEIAPLVGRSIPVEELLEPVAAIYREAPGKSHLERVLYQDVRLYLPHQILMKVDRASMAESLEVRAPLLDTAFAEFVAALPLDAKLHRLEGKAIFKRATARWLPQRIRTRRKKGFAMPIGAWLRGPLRPLADDLLGTLGTAGLVERRVIAQLLDEHQRGVADHRKRLWSLMVLELWRRAHL